MEYLKYRPHYNEIFAFTLVPYTIIDIKNPKNLKYINRGAK